MMTEQEKSFKRDFRTYLRTEKGLKGFSLNSIMDAVDNKIAIVLKQCGKEMAYQFYEDAYSLSELQDFLNCLDSHEEVMANNFGYVSLSALKHYIEYFCKIHQVDPVESVPDVQLSEGEEAELRGVRYERNQEARQKCIEHYGCKCSVCGFDFEERYGEIGRGFTEVHHVVPISERGGAYHVDPVKDLRPLCSNCHSMVHRTKGQTMSLENLRNIISNSSLMTGNHED